MAMDDKMERLLQKYYEKDYYDYREDLVADLGDLDEDAMEIALEARVSKMFPLIDSIGHQLDLTYPDLSVEEIVLAIKYLIDGEMGGSVIIYEDEVLEFPKFTKEAEQVGDKINSWIEAFMNKKHMNFEIVEIVYVFDELIRGFRGSEQEDQFILIPEEEDDEE
jgi:hypothetical protein